MNDFRKKQLNVPNEEEKLENIEWGATEERKQVKAESKRKAELVDHKGW